MTGGVSMKRVNTQIWVRNKNTTYIIQQQKTVKKEKYHELLGDSAKEAINKLPRYLVQQLNVNSTLCN